MSSPTIYLIRHGEKPADETSEDLSASGITRSQALVSVFGPSSPYNIRRIFAQRPKEDGKESRPFKTVEPLAQTLGLKIDTNVCRDEAPELAEAVKKYIRKEDGPGNVLVCWEHKQLKSLVKAITGAPDAPDYPRERFDLIYTVNAPYEKIDSVTSEDTDADKNLSQPVLEGNTIVT